MLNRMEEPDNAVIEISGARPNTTSFLYRGYIYNLKLKTAARERYLCPRSNCGATLTVEVDQDDGAKSITVSRHSHGASEEAKELDSLRKTLELEVKKNPFRPLVQVYEQVISLPQ